MFLKECKREVHQWHLFNGGMSRKDH